MKLQVSSVGRGGKIVCALVRGAWGNFAVGLLTTPNLARVVIRCRSRDGRKSESNSTDAHFQNVFAEWSPGCRNAKQDVSVRFRGGRYIPAADSGQL